MEDRVRALEVDMATVQQRLDAGGKAFESQRQATSALAAKLQAEVAELRPKPISIAKIVGITVSIIAVGGGALWALSAKLNDRPTINQIDSIMDKHSRAADGHPSLSRDIREIRDTQTEQNVQLRTFQVETKKDLDEIKKDVKAALKRRR